MIPGKDPRGRKNPFQLFFRFMLAKNRVYYEQKKPLIMPGLLA